MMNQVKFWHLGLVVVALFVAQLVVAQEKENRKVESLTARIPIPLLQLLGALQGAQSLFATGRHARRTKVGGRGIGIRS